MTTTRITISVPEQVAAKAQRANAVTSDPTDIAALDPTPALVVV